MKKLFCVALLLILTACAATPPSSSEIKPADEDYLIGVSLEEAGYTFNIKENDDLKLSPTEAQMKKDGQKVPAATSYVHSTIYREPASPYHGHSYLGEIHSVFVRMQKTPLSGKAFDGVDVINFQMFKKSEFVQGKYAKILKASVPYEALKSRVLLELDEYVVVDETDYFLADLRGEPVSVDEHLGQKWPNGNPDLDYALSIRDYILSNFDSFLTAQG